MKLRFWLLYLYVLDRSLFRKNIDIKDKDMREVDAFFDLRDDYRIDKNQKLEEMGMLF